MNCRLIKIARTAMSAWARRWRVIRRDRKEAERACFCLEQAIRLRELARKWEERKL